MTRFLVLGDALLDVHATPAEPMRPGADVPAVVRLGVGGQGANLATRLARRGMEVRLACPVGDDDIARLVRDRLDRVGVAVETIPAPATGVVVILLDAAGERTMLSQRVPFASVVATQLPRLASDADWVVVSGYLLEEPGPSLRADATGTAHRAVVGSPFREPGPWRAGVEALAPDLLVLNRAEAASLVGGSTPADLATALARQLAPAVVVVTERDGAVAASAAHAEPLLVATRVDPGVIDTTGAGDAFTATLLAEIGDALPASLGALRPAIERAGAVASAVTRVVGAQAPVAVGEGEA